MGRAALLRSRGRNELFSGDRECKLDKSFCELLEAEALDSLLFLKQMLESVLTIRGEKEGRGRQKEESWKGKTHQESLLRRL